MARLLVYPRPLPHTPLQTQAFTSPGCILLRQTPFLPRSGGKTLPMSPHRDRPPLPHTHVWRRPPHPNLHRAQRHEQLLAQGPEMDNEQLLFHPHLHPGPRGLPPPNRLILQVPKTAGRPHGGLRPPIREPSCG